MTRDIPIWFAGSNLNRQFRAVEQLRRIASYVMSTGSRYYFLVILAIAITSVLTAPVGAQSQAINGQIEGTATDAAGSAVAGARISAMNVSTGVVRTATTSDDGFYRISLLTLG
ncbi:MAG TPA: carboxypeptidase-like regulatory domain-containing protein, partial [Pyrinomonadaceae bacterium]